MRILYNDAIRAPEAVAQELGLEFVSKEQLLRESDFVSLHVPLLDTTRKLIGEAELRARAAAEALRTVEEAALAQALAEGRLAAAGLDVFEHEPQVHPQLLGLGNAVLAPHIASASVDTRREMSMRAVRNCVAALEGRRPENLLNPEVWDSLSSSTKA